MNVLPLKFQADTYPGDSDVYLRPGKVVEVTQRRLKVDLMGNKMWANMAMPYRYDAEIGDIVLAIGQEECLYVIGVIQGQGKTTMQAVGDLELRAPKGRIDLVAAKGVNVRSPSFHVITKKLEFVAENVVECFNNLTSWIKDAFDLRAGSVHSTVESTYRLKAGQIRQKAREDVKIDGEKIHLG